MKLKPDVISSVSDGFMRLKPAKNICSVGYVVVTATHSDS